ncbi:MAG: J domain-containing protein [Parvularculaceae bacterium]
MSYSYRPRHGFDIRVKPPGSRKEPPAWARNHTRKCDLDGCEEKAVVRAAKSPREANTKIWLCAEHARAHNAKWNFFEGLSESEAEAARLSNIYGDRPTWEMGKNERARTASRARGPADLRDSFGLFSEAVKSTSAEAGALRDGRPVSKLQKNAFETLDLAVSSPAPEIRRRYAEMVRRFHPDANGGDRSAETQLQEVVKAHQILKKAGFADRS